MLKPEQIRAHQFVVGGKGTYKAQEVDDYLAEVLQSYEQMFRENGELVRKISLLAERVEAYRNDEDNIRVALLTAQRMADQIQKDANEKAKQQLDEVNAIAEQTKRAAQEQANKTVSIANDQANATINDAQKRARDLLNDAQMEVQGQSNALAQLKNEHMQIKEQLTALYTQQLQKINEMPVFTPAPAQPAAVAATPSVSVAQPVDTPAQQEPAEEQPAQEGFRVHLEPVPAQQEQNKSFSGFFQNATTTD